jgi:hypothetical protein
MTFAEGFAQAYISADQKKQQREQDQEDTMFKYKMENLMSDKKLRVAKQTQEAQNAKKAQDLATQFGDTNSAPYWNTQLNNGVEYDTIYKGIANGDYSPNKNYVKPTQTVQVPSAVSMTYDTGMDGPQYNDVNKKIDAIDPTLRKENITPTVADDSSQNMVTYNPRSMKNLPDMASLYNNLAQAQASKDPSAIRKAQQEVNSAQSAAVWTARTNAQAQGKTGQQMGVVLDDQGRITPGGLVYAETRPDTETGGWKTYNVTDPTANNGQGVPISGNFRIIDPTTMGRLNDVTDKFGQTSKEVKDASANYISALNSANIMTKIAREDPTAVTKWTGGTVEFLNNMKGEAGAAWNQLQMVEQRMNADKQQGKVESLEKDVSDHAAALSDFFNATLTSPANEKTAINAALYRSARQSLVSNLSTANGLSASKTSDKDYEHLLEQVGGEDARWNTVAPAVQQALSNTLINLDARRESLNKDPSVSNFKQLYGFDPGLSVPRLQEMIASGNMDDQSKAELIAYLKQIRQPIDYGQAQAGQQGAQQTGQYKDPSVVAPTSTRGFRPGQVVDGAGGKKFVFSPKDPNDPKTWDDTNQSNWKEAK